MDGVLAMKYLNIYLRADGSEYAEGALFDDLDEAIADYLDYPELKSSYAYTAVIMGAGKIDLKDGYITDYQERVQHERQGRIEQQRYYNATRL